MKWNILYNTYIAREIDIPSLTPDSNMKKTRMMKMKKENINFWLHKVSYIDKKEFFESLCGKERGSCAKFIVFNINTCPLVL